MTADDQPVTGPAIIGEDQCLCWTPCHREPIRLDAAELAPGLPIVVHCPARRCSSTQWTVKLLTAPPGEDAVAVWRPSVR